MRPPNLVGEAPERPKVVSSAATFISPLAGLHQKTAEPLVEDVPLPIPKDAATTGSGSVEPRRKHGAVEQKVIPR
ncbi:MAG: hypothetical protein JOZ08_17900 [Verrucomicrobia bacterium]|nr:hypothetical protein [Verrucomicrobiota bacterium]